MTCRYCLPGYYLILEASAASASNLEWFLPQFAAAELEAARRGGESVYARIDQCVDVRIAAAETGRCSYLSCTGRMPEPMLRRAWWACVPNTTDMICYAPCTRESSSRTGSHCERLLRMRSNPERIRVSGGAARSDVWVQMIADVFQLPVEVPEGSELGALGTAICGSVAAGCHQDYLPRARPWCVSRGVSSRERHVPPTTPETMPAIGGSWTLWQRSGARSLLVARDDKRLIRQHRSSGRCEMNRSFLPRHSVSCAPSDVSSVCCSREAPACGGRTRNRCCAGHE